VPADNCVPAHCEDAAAAAGGCWFWRSPVWGGRVCPLLRRAGKGLLLGSCPSLNLAAPEGCGGVLWEWKGCHERRRLERRSLLRHLCQHQLLQMAHDPAVLPSCCCAAGAAAAGAGAAAAAVPPPTVGAHRYAVAETLSWRAWSPTQDRRGSLRCLTQPPLHPCGSHQL